MLEPLRIRDFALLWTGMSVSLIGDGILLVALGRQTYALSGSPSTLGWIVAAYVSPMAIVLLGGGVLTDRFERRKMMIAADLSLDTSPLAKVEERSARRELREGFAVVRARTWLWATLLVSAIVMVGPSARYVLIPDLIKNDLHASAGALDLVYAVSAIGSIVAAFAYGQIGLLKPYVRDPAALDEPLSEAVSPS